MRKYNILAFMLLIGAAAYAQPKIGLRLAPGVGFNRVLEKEPKIANGDRVRATSDGGGVRFSAGLITDFFFAENYAFSTGLWYTVKKASFEETITSGMRQQVSRADWNAQYVQIPISLKLFTKDIATDMKLYFQLGGTADIKVAERIKEWDSFSNAEKPTRNDKAFQPIDIGLLVGAGVEYQMAETTFLFGGLNYNRSLLNSVTKRGPFNNESIYNARNAYSSSSDLIALEVGIKF